MRRRSGPSRPDEGLGSFPALTIGSRILRALGKEPEDEFHAFAELAAAICWTPMSYVTLLDQKRVYYKGAYGHRLVESPRPGSFCDLAVHQDDIFVMADAGKDPRFLSQGHAGATIGARFYAGVPLKLASSESIGMLCVVDTIQRELKNWQVRSLTLLAEQLSACVEKRLRDAERTSAAQERRHGSRREVDAHLHSMLELSPGIAWILDARGNNVDVSARWEELTGMPRSAACDYGWTRALHPEDLRPSMAALHQSLYHGTAIELEYRVHDVDGSWRHMRSQGRPRRSASGETLFWYGCVEELTPLKSLQQQLAACQAELRGLQGRPAEMEEAVERIHHRLRVPSGQRHPRLARR